MSTWPSRVAENSSPWPPAGTRSSSDVTAGRKPMSAIWSASSRTATATESSEQAPWPSRSSSRPGWPRRRRHRAGGAGPAGAAAPRRRRPAAADRARWPAGGARCGPGRPAPGRDQHQAARPPRSPLAARGGGAGQQRQPEGQRLSRAGLGPAEDVPAGEGVGRARAWIGRGVVMRGRQRGGQGPRGRRARQTRLRADAG